MKPPPPIPVVDLFAGPGGLGEGFSALATNAAARPFKIALSIEKDPIAHKTLLLRSFFRQFEKEAVPQAYYDRLRQRITTAELFAAHPRQAAAARREAWNATLGDEASAPLGLVRQRVREALGRFAEGESRWALIGGPPCQAYSLVGRSRNRGKVGYRLEDDPRARLYLEYLQIIGDFWPAVFVMENVRGLLSARFDGRSVIDLILADLHEPAAALRRNGRRPQGGRKARRYVLHPLTRAGLFESGADFLLRSEKYGIPQARVKTHPVSIMQNHRRVRDGSAHSGSYGRRLLQPRPIVRWCLATGSR